MKTQHYSLAFIAVALAAVGMGTTVADTGPASAISTQTPANYDGQVQVDYYDADAGAWETVSVKHNLLTQEGQNYIRDLISGTSEEGNINYIGISTDTTSPSDTDGYLEGEVTTANLTRRQATFENVQGEYGHLKIRTTFTADGQVTGIRKFGLFPGPIPSDTTNDTANILVAENLISNDINLQDGDRLTVIWDVQLS